MASAITLEGIDETISNLGYKNKTTLKYRFVQHIRQYYTSETSVVSLDEIAYEALIKLLWDTDHDPETIKNKRKNLNSIRSSVNADFKKLYEKGDNPQGIKIGPNNIFSMSEDAKDNILKKLGYELQPDGTLKLDQIMDILILANETVTGSIVVEGNEKKNGLNKIDHLKDLIKGLSEKVGLGSPETSDTDVRADGGDTDDEAGSSEMDEYYEDVVLDDADEVEEISELDDEIAYIEDGDDDEVSDDFEDKEMGGDDDSNGDDLVGEAGIDEEIEDVVVEEEDSESDHVEDAKIDEDVEEAAWDDEEMEPDYVMEVDDISSEATSGGQANGVGPDHEDNLGDINVGPDTAEGDGLGFEDERGRKGNDQLGLPVDSLGREYDMDSDSKLKKDRLLAEEFDGYLGSMDRYYNHYILIQGGNYLVGSKRPKKDEKPEKLVYLEPFYFGRFPITNGLFEIFVEKTGYKTTAEKVGYGTVYYGRFEKKKDETTGMITSIWNSSLYCKTVERACWYQPSGPKSILFNKRNHPVVQISMEDAMAFAAWTGKRLPTENEWEAASRSTKGWIFPWGPEWKHDACNIEESYSADTTPVDKYAKFENDFGIVDTMGNVLEWTNDNFDSTSEKYHGTTYKAVKGGSWISGNDIRLFSRLMIDPKSHSNILGFRCVAY